MTLFLSIKHDEKKKPMSFKALNTMTGSLNISLRFDVVQIGFPKNVGEKL